MNRKDAAMLVIMCLVFLLLFFVAMHFLAPGID